jgi:hypothetical protein
VLPRLEGQGNYRAPGLQFLYVERDIEGGEEAGG